MLGVALKSYLCDSCGVTLRLALTVDSEFKFKTNLIHRMLDQKNVVQREYRKTGIVLKLDSMKDDNGSI